MSDQLQVRDYPVERLTPNDENPRTITAERFAQLVYSLREDPAMLWARPVVALPDGRVIMGNMRLRAALELGWQTIPTVVADLDENTAKLWLLRDNQEYGDWHEQQLAEMLYHLAADEGVDLALAGFEARDLQRLIDSVAGFDMPEVPDTDPTDAAADAETMTGEVVELGPHRVVCGDATSEHDRDLLLGAAGVQQIDLCFTSPPYAGLRSYDGTVADRGEGTSQARLNQDSSPEQLASFLEVWGPHVKLFCVNLGIVRDEWSVSTYWDHYIDAARQAGLKLLSWNVWDRGAPRSIGHHIALFPIEHEFIFVFGKEPFEQVPIVPNKAKGIRQQRPQNKSEGSHTSLNKSPRQVASHRNLGTVIRMPPETNSSEVVGDHPAPYPVRLPADYMRALTPRGGVVLDPFLGSGSTLIAADALGRRCLGVEKLPRYVDGIRRRYERNQEKSERVDP